MGALVAILGSALAFLVPLAVPLAATRWRGFLVVLASAMAFFAWLTVDLAKPGSVLGFIGPFLGGLMLFGFVAGAIARFVMLVGRR
ncbi:MAG: hypothetical protein IPK28_07560 [Devosia sp.]|nr:hypothetical protein [Devosia sp.]